MDEADILGDRIAIMSAGTVRCCGSSLFLKQKFGVGYTFVVSLEAGVKPITVKSAIDNLVLGSVQSASVLSVAGGEISYRLPFSETAVFPSMFESLDAQKKELKITGYGVSATTLEEVFMKIGEDFGATPVASASKSNMDDDSKLQITPVGHVTRATNAKENEDDGENEGLAKMFAQPTFRLAQQQECFVLLAHTWAILYKRLWWAVRDVRAMFFVIVLPCLLAALNFGVQNLQLAIDYPNLIFHVDQWYPPKEYQVPFATFTGSVSSVNELYNDNQWEMTYETSLSKQWGSIVKYGVNSGSAASNATTLEWKRQLFENRGGDEETQARHYTSVYLDPLSIDQVSAGFNLSASHGFPTALSMVDNWLLQYLVPSTAASIVTSTHPLPATKAEKVYAGSIAGLTASLTLTIALVFVPVGIVFPVVQERRQQMKHQQMVSGVSFVSYWLGQLIADFMVSLPTCALIVMMVHIFDVTAFKGDAELVFVAVMLLFLLSVLPLTYLLSLLFDSPDKAQASFTALYILLGLVLSIVTYVLMIISEQTKQINDVLEYFFRASPMYCVAHSLILVSFKPSVSPDLSYWDSKISGRSLSAMAVEAVVYFVLLLTVEYVSGFPSLMTQLGFTVDAPKPVLLFVCLF
ncbi:ABC transporter family protein, partial [Reticulomyxa filosa]